MHLDPREQGLQQISGLRRAKSNDTRRVRSLRPNSLDPSFSLDRSSNKRDEINRLSQLVHVQPGHEVEPRRFFLKHQRIESVQIFQSRNQTTPVDQLVRKIDTLRIDPVPQLTELRDLDFFSASRLPGELHLLLQPRNLNLE